MNFVNRLYKSAAELFYENPSISSAKARPHKTRKKKKGPKTVFRTFFRLTIYDRFTERRTAKENIIESCALSVFIHLPMLFGVSFPSATAAGSTAAIFGRAAATVRAPDAFDTLFLCSDHVKGRKADCQTNKGNDYKINRSHGFPPSKTITFGRQPSAVCLHGSQGR